MNNFPIVFGTIVVTVVVAALLYDHATPHETALGHARPASSFTESKASLPASVASASAASENTATKAIKNPSKIVAGTSKSSPSTTDSTVETQRPVDLNDNQSPSGSAVIKSGDQPAGSSDAPIPPEGG